MATIINELNILAFAIAPVFYKLLFMSIAALCIGAVILLFRRFADSRISPAWKYALWLVMLVALAIPYRLQTEAAPLDPVARIQEVSYREEYDQVRKSQHDVINIEQPTPGQQAESDGLKTQAQTVFLKSLIFDVAIPLLWLSGAVALALFMLISRMRLVHRLKKHQPEAGGRYHSLLRDCKSALGIRRDVQLYIQDYIGSPALLGFVRPKIILPSYAEELSDESLKYILLHELSHHRRFDMLLHDFLLLLQTVYWFNPLVWLMFRYIRQDMELANDASVMRRIGNENGKAYSRSLVEVLGCCSRTRLTPKLLCVVNGKDNMERRLRMIKLGEHFKKRRFLVAAVSIAIICTVSILFLTQSPGSRDTMKWARKLSISDVKRIELVVMPSSENERYRLFEEDELGEVIALINQSKGKYLDNPEAIAGGAATLYITTQDGTRHRVTNIGNVQLFIDGDYYDAGYGWLSSWKYKKGNAPLPEDFSFEDNAEGEKLQAFKGLELYVWKSPELVENEEPYFTLLEGTNRSKEQEEIYDLDAATSDIRAIGQKLSRYGDGLYLQIYQMNEADFTKEQMMGFSDELMKYMPPNSSLSVGLFELPPSPTAEPEEPPVEAAEYFNKLGITVLLPENENWIGNPTYSIIDESIAQVEYYDKFVETDMVLRAGKEDIQTLSGITYSFDKKRTENWSARTFKGEDYIEIKVQYAVSGKEIKGVLASWSYKDVNYMLWGALSDKDMERSYGDVSPIAKTAVYVAQNMR